MHPLPARGDCSRLRRCPSSSVSLLRTGPQSPGQSRGKWVESASHLRYRCNMFLYRSTNSSVFWFTRHFWLARSPGPRWELKDTQTCLRTNLHPHQTHHPEGSMTQNQTLGCRLQWGWQSHTHRSHLSWHSQELHPQHLQVLKSFLPVPHSHLGRQIPFHFSPIIILVFWYLFFFFFNIYLFLCLFIWLYHILILTCRIFNFIVVCGI